METLSPKKETKSSTKARSVKETIERQIAAYKKIGRGVKTIELPADMLKGLGSAKFDGVEIKTGPRMVFHTNQTGNGLLYLASSLAYKLDKRKFKAACKGSGGIKTVIADNYGITTETIRVWLQKYPDLQEHIDAAEKEIVNSAKSVIHKAISGEIGDTKDQLGAAKWFLSKRDADFKDKVDVSGSMQNQVFINIPNNKR